MANDAQTESLATFRNEFVLPTNRDIGGTKVVPELLDQTCTYLCGNSLGALPRRSESIVKEEFGVWGSHAVEGHFNHPLQRPWLTVTDHVNPLLADLLGAKENEVACMGTLTSNLHIMINVFYKPTAQRYKILCEAKAFPSDQYAFASQVRAHGFDPADAIIQLAPRKGEYTLRESDILETIEREGSKIALVLFPGIQYYTGQRFPMASVTRAAQAQGCICAWDLAHAIGNVPLSLHDWGVDFAVWCSYKYLNSGPGGIGGLYMHERWDGIQKPREAGWWGHDLETRFEMPPTFSPIRGAQGFQQSNPSALAIASLLGSLQVFREAGMMKAIRQRSLVLTTHLEKLLKASKYFIPVSKVQAQYPSTDKQDASSEQEDAGHKVVPAFTIITPADPEERGAQLSLLFFPSGKDVMPKVFAGLKSYGVIGDERQPDVIRLAPAALYNTLEDCETAARYLERVLEEIFN